VAGILRIAKNTVYELVKRGELRCYRVGAKFRFDRADIDAYKTAMRGGASVITANPQFAGSGVSLAAPLPAEFVQADARPQTRSGSASFVLCGQDILLEVLSRRLEAHPDGTRVLRSYQGSYNGLYALYTGNADAATAHLWDGATGSYNLPYLRHLLPGTRVVVLRLASRKVGFYVVAGNPKGLRDWNDLKRRDLVLVNRERGSGIRVLLDERLLEAGLEGAAIPGYERECGTHLAVASVVARGGADFAIGSEKASLMVKGVDFIPLQEERYDLVFRSSDARTPLYAALVDIVRSAEFREELEGLGGYGLDETGRFVTD
jgi:putative molybdopterin biosynthesis protein